jgi:NAD+ dependent glucose-6-phosphate dehydrogenase
LITGAGGNIGAKIRRHFTGLGWNQRLVDVATHGDASIAAADLSLWSESWVELFAGVDTVIHLAGYGNPRTSWPDVVRYNLDLTQNVYEAAVRRGVRRLVFASSNWVVAGHRFSEVRLTTDLDPYPVNAYGASKLFGERLGRSYHERSGLEVICLRIGYCQRGDNLPGKHMGWKSWGQLMWLSDRDLCNAMERSVLAQGIGFEVLNVMSDNPGMRWDIETTKRVIGYAPQDGAAAEMTEAMKADEGFARQLRNTVVQIEEIVADRRL